VIEEMCYLYENYQVPTTTLSKRFGMSYFKVKKILAISKKTEEEI
jgi:hypothetical protein